MVLAGFPLSAILLGVINTAIVVAILLLVGAIIQWGLSYIGVTIPDIVVKLYIGVVVLIAIYMVVALLLGLPVGPHIIGST